MPAGEAMRFLRAARYSFHQVGVELGERQALKYHAFRRKEMGFTPGFAQQLAPFLAIESVERFVGGLATVLPLLAGERQQ